MEGNGAISPAELRQQGAVTQPVRGDRSSPSNSERTSWFEAMSGAWGNTLDRQTSEIVDLSNQISNGEGGSDSLGTMVHFQAAVHRLNFLSQAANTSQQTSGEALQTLARRN